MELSVIIPAYNEAKRIGRTLGAVGAWLATQPFDSEIVVVDNRSTDATADIVREYQQRFRSIRLTDEPRPGKGYAVANGMLFATGRVRLFMDADNSTSIEHYEKMRPYLDQGYDVVIGSLAVKGAKIMQGGGEPLWRVVLGKLGNLWIQFWAVPGIWDTQRGFKIFTERAARDIFPKLSIFGWGFDVEVLAVARAHTYRIKEVPVTWNNDPDSKVNAWAYPKVLLDTVKVGINRLIGKYRA
ncbi:MAG TPA: dolichyl-phosphate beta-glucosyltransferase [Candidatus Paceibacterota bacterium]|nr:dolichyl-phosphate beta-glucosyltransferase [Candidatus Paceibacterota bacterium]